MINQNDFIGKYIGGSYKIIAEIGDGIGSFGSVYLAEHIIFTERPFVAIKILHTYLPVQEHNRFIQEAKLLEKLKNHPHILPIVQAGIHDNLPFLVTDYAAHGSLRNRLKQPLPLERAFAIISQIGIALHDAHKLGIVHRDLKPENILLNDEDNALLADFGIALVLDRGETATHQQIEGTLPYMAPEQFEGTVSLKSDQYALGCIAYELLTGRKPIEAKLGYNINREAKIAIWAIAHVHDKPIAPRTLNTDLSKQVEAALLKAIAKNRQDRHASISDFLVALGLPPPEPITGKLPESNFLNLAAQWLINGDTFFRGEDYEQALQAFNLSLSLDPDNADTYLRIGNVFRKLKRYNEALDAYEKGVQVALENKRDIFYCNMGHVLCDLKMYEDAFKAYNEAIRLSPKKAIFHVNKGDAFRAFRDLKGALYAYEEAIQCSNSGITSAKAYAGMGEAFMGLKRCPEATKAYEEAIKQQPTNAMLYLAKGYLHWKCHQNEEACKAYMEGLKVDPTNELLLEKKNLVCR